MSFMALNKFRRATETGQEVGVVLVNTDEIVTVGASQNGTEFQMAEGRTRRVRDSHTTYLTGMISNLIKSRTPGPEKLGFNKLVNEV